MPSTAIVFPLLVAVCLGFVAFRKGRRVTVLISTLFVLASWGIVMVGLSMGGTSHDNTDIAVAILGTAMSIVPGLVLLIAALAIARCDSPWATAHYSESKRLRAEQKWELRDASPAPAIVFGVVSALFTLEAIVSTIGLPSSTLTTAGYFQFILSRAFVVSALWGGTAWFWRRHKTELSPAGD